MRALFLLFGLLVVATPPGIAESPDGALQALSWLEGTWTGDADGVSMEEIWTAPAGGLMLGLHRDVFPSGSAFFEYLRIERTAEGLVYFASPRGRPPTAFKMVEIGDQRVVFENLEHDFPQRIIYRRVGEVLVARVEGVADGETRSQEWSWTRGVRRVSLDDRWNASEPREARVDSSF